MHMPCTRESKVCMESCKGSKMNEKCEATPKDTKRYVGRHRVQAMRIISFFPIARFAFLLCSLWYSVQLRLYAVRKYGRVIHEYDPWFNFRATEYLSTHGYEHFKRWYDDKSWYPIGRPIGTTTFPGIMITSAFLFSLLPAVGFSDVSLNDVCVFVPILFAIFSILATYGLALEVSNCRNTAVCAAGIMSVIPAHTMRTVAGGYDNESVAIAAICVTFFLWVRSLRTPSSWPVAFLCAGTYIFLVSSWGAYIFVLNMIGLHVGILVLTGRHTSKLHRAYSVFYVVGTIGALQVPVVGWRPLQSMEQLGPMAIFIFIQIMELVPVVRTYYSKQLSEDQFWHTNVKRFSFACSIFVVIMSTLLRIVNSGSLSARVRSLFITHTRTGNPLVDSVAEHQRTNLIAFIQFFHTTFMLIPVGFILCFFVKRTDAVIFQGTYLLVSCYFSTKMVRLILLLAQPASIAASMATISITTWALDHAISDEDVENSNYVITSTKLQRRKTLPMQKGEKKGMKKSGRIVKELDAMFGDQSKSAKKMIARILIAVLSIGFYNFISHSFRMAEHLSEPRVMFQRRESDGSVTTIDDFREAYWWLRDETPEDSRVLAWWDYGYQINGIANRTTLADGNTWNHEHIALIGKMLVSNEVEAHGMIKHLADYVLVMTTQWGGMWGDDLTKMPHMAKVAGSVYDDVDGLGYYFDKDHQPSALMRESLLYMLHGSRLDPDIIQPKHFSEVYTSRNKMVRIYEVKQVSEGSKSYSLKHRSYPPALTSVLRRKKNFNSAAYERL